MPGKRNCAHWQRALLVAVGLALAACSGGPQTRSPVAPPTPKPKPPRSTPATPTPTPSVTVVEPEPTPYAEDAKNAKQDLARNERDSLALLEVGYYMDVLHGRLKQHAGKNVGVGRQGQFIVLVLTGDVGFAPGTAQFSAGMRDSLAKLAKVLVEYRKTTVTVRVRGDDPGATLSNPQLAGQRRRAVADFLVAAGVNERRIVIAGVAPTRAPAAKARRGVPLRVELQLEPILR